MLDLVPFPPGRIEGKDAQAEVGGQGDMLGLPDVEAFSLQGVQTQLARGADRR